MILAALVALAWFLSSLEVERKLALTGAIRATVLAPFVSAHARFELRGELTARAARLEEERDRLARLALRATDLDAENVRLRALLGLPPRMTGDYVAAELVPGRPAVGDSHTFLLRVGAEQGLSAPVAVVNPAGLVGVVRSVASGKSFGEFWSHPDFRVSVRADSGPGAGIIRPVASSSGETLMLLEGVPFQMGLAPGTRLVTAGVGGVYPSGIPVGTVLQEAESQSGWSRSYRVEPAARPAEVGFVLVWRRPSMEELVPALPPPVGDTIRVSGES